ncbi:cold-shock protein [Streptomyces lasalocidi]|uniref:cold-shock protein n=1 Tax=Streptomyces lasalocidi TaxID=324833 RepID=UPI001F4FF317|nr:cold shock domain-containing protein [Streptomyces lasalocidi]
MSDATSADVVSGHVLEWHSEEGWGVLASDALPDRVWAHYSVIQAEGYRELTVGQSVTFSAEQAEQDEYRWRAVSVWPEAGVRRAPSEGERPGYSSDLNIRFDS